MYYFLLRRVHPSFIVVLFSSGIILGVIVEFICNFWIFNSLIWLLVVLALLLINFHCTRLVALSLALIAGIITGSLRISSDLGDSKYIQQFIGQKIEVSGIIYEDPEFEGATTLRLTQLIFGDKNHHRPAVGNLYVKLYTHEPLERSYKITITGKLSPGFGSFAGTLYNPKLISTAKPDPPDLALEFRNNFADLIKKFIPAPEVDLSLGYLLGQRRALPASLLETLKIVGLTHIIVASGYNLSVLVRLSRRIFKRISRFAALFSGLLLIVIFMAIAGFTPSMSRAGLVASASLIAWFFGRKFHPVKLLLLAASTTLLLNPFYIQDLGWILSFLSFTGVLIVSPLLTAYFYHDQKPNFLASPIIETMAAQICCLPILLFFFGSFSIVSLPANILILPTIPATMLLTFLTGLTAPLAPLASIFGWLAAKLLSFHILVIEFFGNLNWALVQIPTNSLLILLIYPAVAATLIYIKYKTNFRFIDYNVIE